MTKTKRATKIARGTLTSARAKSTAKPQANAHANSLTKPLARPHGNRLIFATELMADGKRRYETTPESLDSIALDFGSNRSTLKNIARRENWVRYVPPPRGLSRAADIAARAEALEAEALNAASLSLPPRSGGEGRFGERQRDEAGWGDAGQAQTLPNPGASLPPTPDPSPPLALLAGGGENGVWSMRARIDALRGAVDEEIAAVRALRASLKGVPHSTETASRTSRTLADLTTTLERLHRLEIGASQHKGQDTHADRFSDMPADPDAFRDELARRIRAFVASRAGLRDAEGDSGPAGVDAVR